MAGMKLDSIKISITRAEEYILCAGGGDFVAELAALRDGPLAAQVRAWEVRLAAELGIGKIAAGRHVAAAMNKVLGAAAAPDTGWGGKRR